MRGIFAALAMTAALSGAAMAQDYPNKPIQLVITSAPGSSVELLARAFGEALSAQVGQPVIPNNKPGAANVIGTEFVSVARPDGYTLGFSTSGPFSSQPFLQNLSYKPDNFEFICQLLELQIVLTVRDESPFKTFDDVIEAARKEPGSIAVGTTGAASIPHIALAQIEHMKGVKFNHIFYRGDAPALQATRGGEIHMAGIALGSISGQPMRALAILGSKRVPTHPNVPTGVELGYPVIKTGMVGFFAPKGLPAPVRRKLDAACVEAAKSPVFLEAAKKLNQPVEYVNSEDWQKGIAADAKDNKEVIERLGLKEKQ